MFSHWCGDVFVSKPDGGDQSRYDGFLGRIPEFESIDLGIIVGCMSAFDMGGPVNKAAYVTGTALLAQGNHTFMAGVSAACIAPPLITGFAVLFLGNILIRTTAMQG